MKPQIKRSNYCHFPKYTAPFAIVCALGMLQFASPATMTYAIADPVVEGSTVKPNADGVYDFSDDKDIQNPFPDVITPAEVQELQDKTKSVRPLPYIEKKFYTPYGKEFSVKNGQASGDTKTIDEIINSYSGRLGRIDIFIFIPRVNKDSVYTGDGQFYAYRSSRELKNSDGSVDFDFNKAPDEKLPYRLEVNGKLIGSNLANETHIQFYMRTNQTFIHVVMEGGNANEAVIGHEGLNHESSSAAPGFFAFIPECGAQFHFVDDLQYRKVTKIEGNNELPQRSAGETDRFSTKPFAKLDLPDLSESKNVAGVRFGKNQVVHNMITSLLSFEDDPKKDSVKRPTMKELTGTNIPGYLYYSNDIDTPEGGTFTKENTKKFGNYDYGIVRDKDDNQVTTKHYYVTFRPIPTQLVVQYKNTDGTLEVGNPYELYAAEKQITGDFKSVKKLDAPTKKQLEALIKNKNTTLLSDAAGYVSNGLVYLAPGTYTVKPTAKAPDGYEWVVETTGSEQKSQADVTVAKHINDDDPTQQVVTFVLKKKGADEKQESQVAPLYRLYNPYTHEHFFTAETTENDNLVRLGWKSEGGVGYIYKHAEKGGVYRLYNPTTGEHHYTMKEDEVDQCVKAGWKNEGVKWFSAQDKEVTLNKLYSMYNPYEKKFYHHYTADAKEIEQMVKAGWRKEEVKWCTLPVSYIIKK